MIQRIWLKPTILESNVNLAEKINIPHHSDSHCRCMGSIISSTSKYGIRSYGCKPIASSVAYQQQDKLLSLFVFATYCYYYNCVTTICVINHFNFHFNSVVPDWYVLDLMDPIWSNRWSSILLSDPYWWPLEENHQPGRCLYWRIYGKQTVKKQALSRKKSQGPPGVGTTLLDALPTPNSPMIRIL